VITDFRKLKTKDSESW